MIVNPDRITEEEARALWQRAAELQSAAEKAGQRIKALTPADGEGFSLEQVSAGAQGAGIDPDYVRLALAERRLPDAHAIRPDRRDARWFRRLMGNAPDAIEFERMLNAPGAVVLPALRSVFTGPPFALIPESSLGEDLLRDGVLVYRINKLSTPFHNDLEWADARVIIVALRAEGDRTRVRVRVPLFRRGINLALTGGSAGLFGAGGTWGGATIG
ncbi:MAG: hypothetical protein ACREMA_19890, partial [Longimicrobiales bacterium]